MSSNNNNININNNNNNNNFIEIKNSLNEILNKIKHSNSKENYNLFKNLINNHIYNKTNMNFIFSNINEFIDSNIKKKKK